MSIEPITTRIAEKEVPIMMGSPTINTVAGTLLAAIDALTGKAVGEAEVPANSLVGGQGSLSCLQATSG